MAGIADNERACTALRAIERIVDTPMGLPMLAPSFTSPNYKVGQITCYPTGHHHNGVWHHTNTWVMIAECMTGRPDRALELYMKIFPPRQSAVYENNIPGQTCPGLLKS